MFQMLNFEEARKLVDEYVKKNKESFTEDDIRIGVMSIKFNYDINGLRDNDLRLKATMMGIVAAYSYIEELSYNGEDLEEA